MEKIISPFGLDWRRNLELPLLRHELFFKFLLLSPSYWIAHQIRNGNRELIKESDIPIDIDKVLEKYDLFGDIYQTTFDRWWSVCGRDIFDLTRKRKTLAISINLDKSEQEILKSVKILLKKIKEEKSDNKKIKLVKSKIHDQTLQDRFQVVSIKSMHAKSSNEDKKRDQNWKIYIWLRAFNDGDISRIYAGKGLNVKSKILARNEAKRHYYGMAVCRYLKESLYIAENAARGIFPSRATTVAVNFDYRRILHTLNENHLNGIKQDNVYTSNSGLLTRSQFKKTRKKLISKNKITAKIKKEAIRIISNRENKKNLTN